jgi:hypothetical protein
MSLRDSDFLSLRPPYLRFRCFCPPLLSSRRVTTSTPTWLHRPRPSSTQVMRRRRSKKRSRLRSSIQSRGKPHSIGKHAHKSFPSRSRRFDSDLLATKSAADRLSLPRPQKLFVEAAVVSFLALLTPAIATAQNAPNYTTLTKQGNVN